MLHQVQSLSLLWLWLLVWYKCRVNIWGLPKKVIDPSEPSSILDNLYTSALGLPTTSPSKTPAICSAVNFILSDCIFYSNKMELSIQRSAYIQKKCTGSFHSDKNIKNRF